MANTDWNQRIREEVEAIRAGGAAGAAAPAVEPVCQAGDLKGLLNTIVEQISDADRRHTDTLLQMQDRITNMGREASTLRSKVPLQFANAFERIEAGMADLALKIAEAGDLCTARTSVADAASAHHETAEQAYEMPAPAPASSPASRAVQMGDEPVALRTGADAGASRKRDEDAKRHAEVDPFDVIESLPGNASDPWDRDSAEALAGLYEPQSDPYGAQPEPSHRSYTTPASMAMTPAGMPAVDNGWLEARFSEISSRIEQSIAELRPDHAFFALNQRIDQLENHFTGLMEGAASHADVEGIRLIEAHMSELATHLEGVHDQLARLDIIETQLTAISGKLDDVHGIATASAADPGEAMDLPPPVDVDAVAKAAADQIALRFADLKPQADPTRAIEDVHGLIERFMSESRQGEENTNVLLDTVQQAMIRLLDRVDAMELAQQQSIISQAHAQAHAHAQTQAQAMAASAFSQPRFAAEPQRSSFADDSGNALDAAVAAVAGARSAAPFAHVPADDRAAQADSIELQPQAAQSAASAAQRTPERIRQDFIADARRAKLRLAAEQQEQGDVVIAQPAAPVAAAATAEPAAAGKPGKAAKRTDKAGKAKAAAGGTPSPSLPRLMVMGLGVLTLLGGVWYMMQGGGGAPDANMVAPAAINAPVAGAKPAEKGVSDAQPGTPAVAPQEKAPSNDRSDLSPDGTTTVGEIVTGEIAEGSTSVPLGGIAVDAQRPIAADELQRAQRKQSMAAMSTRVGQAAAKTNAITEATPASLIPDAAAQAGAAPGVTAVEKNTMTRRSALDMPPVTVGPLSLRLAAANGDPSAEFEVGARLAEGKGTGQSFEEAAKWYQRSADQGFVQSQYRLGTLYERGLGVKPDLAKAEDWYKRAAEQGNVKAMHNLAVLSANQNKASPDYTTAAKWFTDAAERGLSDIQFNLAVLYENGLGVPQDAKQAYKWLSLAAKSGDKEAVRRRDIMKGKLTAPQISDAEAMLKTWMSKAPDPLANDARTAGEAWKKNPANGQNG